MWLLSLDGLKLPGSAAARSRPTDGFSAMTRVLLTRSSLAALSPAAISVGTGSRSHRPAGLPQRVGDDRVRHAEADPLAAPNCRGEDRREHAPATVDHRPARVARAHEPAQRRDLAQH